MIFTILVHLRLKVSGNSAEKSILGRFSRGEMAKDSFRSRACLASSSSVSGGWILILLGAGETSKEDSHGNVNSYKHKSVSRKYHEKVTN